MTRLWNRISDRVRFAFGAMLAGVGGGVFAMLYMTALFMVLEYANR